MNNKYTLKELADIAKNAAEKANKESQEVQWGAVMAKADRPGFIWSEIVRAILDAIGYEFPKDEEREAFDAWCNANHKLATTDQFEAWKAGREELLKTQALAKEPDTKTEPAWIPWHGGSKSPITGARTRYEIEYRDGAKTICTHNTLRWSHNGTAGDIIAYRIIY